MGLGFGASDCLDFLCLRDQSLDRSNLSPVAPFPPPTATPISNPTLTAASIGTFAVVVALLLLSLLRDPCVSVTQDSPNATPYVKGLGFRSNRQ